MGKLDGKRVAFLATDGVEQVELTEPSLYLGYTEGAAERSAGQPGGPAVVNRPEIRPGRAGVADGPSNHHALRVA